MCTVILLRRPGHRWPLLVAANRDERLDRAWDPPAAWWPGQPGTLAGRDRMAGGTWMALGPSGVLAAILNRPGSLGPEPGKRSRGDIPLMLAAASSAAEAARIATALPAAEWRPFNLVIADRQAAFFFRALGHGHPEAMPIPQGISMVTAHDPNDPASPRTRRHLPRFQAAPPPDPDAADWSAWETLLACSDHDAAIGRAETLNVPPDNGFGTVCSSLMAFGPDTIWRFCPAPPGTAAYRPLTLPGSDGPRGAALLYGP